MLNFFKGKKLIALTALIILILILGSSLLLKTDKTSILPPLPLLIAPTPSPKTITPKPTLPLLERSDIVQEKNWLLELPLKNPEYYVDYDYDNNSLEIQLYPPTAFYVSKEDQVKALKEIVLNRLKELGIDTNKEKINWIVK